MTQSEIKRNIEALLFIHGEALSLKKIGEVLGVDIGDVQVALQELRDEYKERGIVLLEGAEGAGFATHPDAGVILEGFVAKTLEEPLTPAALETLSIVAYLGPIQKIEIDEMRGVNSHFSLKNLTVRGLVEKGSQDENKTVYDITFDALRYLGVSKKEELPSYMEFRERLLQVKGGS